MDNETKLLEEMSRSITLLELKFRRATTLERAELRPALEELLNEYASFRVVMLTIDSVTSDADLAEMHEIRDAIDKAADKQSTIFAIAKAIAFITARV